MASEMPDTHEVKNGFDNKDGSQIKDSSVQFMLAEFGRIQAGEIHNRSNGDSRVNLHVTLLSLLGGGIVALHQTTDFAKPGEVRSFSFISAFALFFMSILGIIIFRLLLERWRLTVIYLRKLARIRKWFLAKDPSLEPSLVYPTDESYPPYLSKRFLTSSLILIVSLLNCMSIGSFTAFGSLLIIPSVTVVLAGIIGLIVGIIVWFLQRSLAIRILQGFENDEYTKAPFGKNPKI